MGRAAGALVVAVRRGVREETTALDRARGTVREATSFSFTMTETVPTLETDGGTETVTIEGRWTKETWDIVVDQGTRYAILDEDGTRSITWEPDGEWSPAGNDRLSEDDLRVLDPQDPERSAPILATHLYLTGPDGIRLDDETSATRLSSPDAFLHLIEAMDGEKLTDELEAPEEVGDRLGHPLPSGRVRLEVDDDGRPTSLVLEVGSGDAAYRAEVAFSGWNEPVEIPAPPEWPAVRPLVPTPLPDGWELTLADTGAGDDDCPGFRVEYDHVVAGEGGHTSLRVTSAACELADDRTPFEPGGPGGHPGRSLDRPGAFEIQVGDLVVGVETTLEGAPLDAAMASLAPVDLSTLESQLAADEDDGPSIEEQKGSEQGGD